MRASKAAEDAGIADKQRAEHAKAEQTRKDRTSRLTGMTHAKSPFLAFLGKHGINITEKNEFSPDKNQLLPGYGPLFRKTGLPVDQLIQRAVEDGYLPPGTNDDVKLRDLITQQMSGKSIAPMYTEDGADNAMQAEIDRRAQFEEDDAVTALSTHTYTSAELDALDALDDVPFDVVATGPKLSTEASMKEWGFSEQEIQDAVAEERIAQSAENEKSSINPGQTDAGRPQTGTGATQSATGKQDEGLTAPTREDILAQQDRADNADALDAKAQIDREVPLQTLTSQHAPDQRSDNTNDMFGLEKAQAELDKKNAGKQAEADPNQGSMFDDLAKPSRDGFGDKFKLDLNSMFMQVPYRAAKPTPLENGQKVLSSEIITRKTSVPKSEQQAYDLPPVVLAWRVSAIQHPNGAIFSRTEAMFEDHGRAPGGEVVAYFKEVDSDFPMSRFAPSVEKAAIKAYENATNAIAPDLLNAKPAADMSVQDHLRAAAQKIDDAAKSKPKKPTPAQQAESRLADYFTPGNVVKGYNGTDRVIAFTPADAQGKWSVTVESVRLKDGAYVPVSGTKQQESRTHSTQPSERELTAGPLVRAEPVFKEKPETAGESIASVAINNVAEKDEPSSAPVKQASQVNPTETPAFKAWFGDWKSVAIQNKLDAMQSFKIKIPSEWRGKPLSGLREMMASELDRMVKAKIEIQHPEIGVIRVGRRGAAKSESTSRDPAKMLAAADIENALPKSIVAGFTDSSEQGVDGYTKLLLPIGIDGHELVAIFTVRHQTDGSWYYNTVTVADNKKGPGSYESSGAESRPLEQTPITGLDSFIRQPLNRVNTATVSKVVDAQGKPLVMYHGTSATESGDAFTSFDAYASNYGLMGMGGYFTADPAVASSYTTKGKGASPTVYPVYLAIKNPMDMDGKADAAAWKKQFDGIEPYHKGGETNEAWYRAAEESLSDQYIPQYEGAEIMQDGLRAMGFDGITHIGGGRVAADGVRHQVYIAFDPEQIKSATGNNGDFDPKNPDIRFSRAKTLSEATTGLPTAQVQSITDAIKARWKNAPEIVIVASMDDKAIPQAVRDHNDGQLSQGAQGSPEGFLYGGKVYLVADQLASPTDVIRVLFHEALGHVGLRGVFGDSLKSILQQVALFRKAEVAAKAKEYGLDMSIEAERLQAAEEVLANLAQTKPELGFVKRAIAAIRTWLRANVPGFSNLKVTDAEIVNQYILPARRFVEGGKPESSTSPSAKAQANGSVVRERDFPKDKQPSPKFAKIDANANKNGQSLDSVANKQAIDRLSNIVAADLGIAQPNGSSAYAPVSLPEQRSLGIIASAFGKSAVGYKLNSLLAGKKTEFEGIAGVSVGSIPDTVFINANSPRPHLSILGHELAHELARDNKPLYNELVNAIRAYTKADFYRNNFPNERVARGLRDADAIREEFIGEILSDGFTEPKFWEALGDKNPALIKKVYGLVAELIAKIKVAFGVQRRTEKYLTDFDAVMKLAGEVMAKYGVSKGNSQDSAPKYSRATAASLKDRISDKLNERKTSIVGQTSRQYSAEQLAAMKSVGFQVETKSLADRAKSLWQDAGKKMAQGIADQFAPVKALDGAAYGLLRLSKGASGAFETFLKGGQLKISDGVYDFDDASKGGVIDQLLTPLQGEHHDFMRWVAANRAERLRGEGKENLFTEADIKALKTLQDGQTGFDYTLKNGIRKGQVTRNRAEIYRDSLATFNGFNKNILDMAEQSGLIDGDSRKLWEQEFYVPFYRVADEDSGGVRGMNIKGGVMRQQAFKELKGGKNALNADLLDNTLMNWAHLLDASAKNRAAKATIEAAERMGIATGGNQTTLAQMGASINNKNGVVWFMDGGQKRYSLIDNEGDGPYLMTALTALEYAGMRNPVMNAMSTFKHVLTVGVTASPFFKVRNLIRDSVQVIGTSGIDVNPAKNIAQGWKLTDPKSDAYFRLLAGGGTIHFGTMMEGSEAKRVQSLVEAGVDDATILNSDKKVQAFYRKFIAPGVDAYNELGNRGEAVNRAALYDQLRKGGMNHADASLQARDLMDGYSGPS